MNISVNAKLLITVFIAFLIGLYYGADNKIVPSIIKANPLNPEGIDYHALYFKDDKLIVCDIFAKERVTKYCYVAPDE